MPPTAGENITVFFVNNAIYGMTGGQMAPTTLLGQKTSTTPLGRNAMQQGFPLKICEMLSSLEGTAYLERVALAGPKNHMKARAAVRKAIRYQMEGRGFSLVEVLSACPTGWKIKPADAWRWIEEQMLPVFPLAVYKDTDVKLRISSRGSSSCPFHRHSVLSGSKAEREQRLS